MLDTQKLVGLVEQLATAVHKRVTAAEQKAEASAQKVAAHVESQTASASTASGDLDTKVKTILEGLFPSIDLSGVESAVQTLSSSPIVQAGETILAGATGIDVPGIASAIQAATNVASDIVQAATQGHADAKRNGATTAVAVTASKEAAIDKGAPETMAKALASLVATSIQAQKDTGAPVEQVVAAAKAHDDQTDENNVALPGTDPVAAAYHAAADKGADEATASTIASAVAAVAPTTVAS